MQSQELKDKLKERWDESAREDRASLVCARVCVCVFPFMLDDECPPHALVATSPALEGGGGRPICLCPCAGCLTPTGSFEYISSW